MEPVDVEHGVLDIVQRLVSEVSGIVGPRPELDDVLDRDLGISSLERVELLLRLEQTFGVRLPDAVMVDAATPQDLVTAIRKRAGVESESARLLSVPAVPSPSVPASIPTSARSLVDALRSHAERSGDRVHVHLRNDDGPETVITYGALATSATSIGGALRDLGIAAGDRVALMLRTERAFFETFVAALAIGAVPVPLYPPARTEDLLVYTRRQQGILQNAGARALVTFADAERIAKLIGSDVRSLEATVTADDLRSRNRPPVVPIRAQPGDLALIQYTSGSTGDPKGVQLSHANLLANIRAVGQALDIRADDAGVSWLPLYHDMGLIGLWLGALYFGVPITVMSPLAFLARPSRWLHAIHAHRGTISAAPNFAFDLCARKITDAEIDGLDLSSWRIAINGSEAVRPDTIERFTQRFAPYGFQPTAMCPAYGLAESSVALTIGPVGRAPRVDAVARDPFERHGRIEAASPTELHALRLVACGRPLSDHEVRIMNAAGQPCGERVVGHIQFRGPSMTRGYFRRPDATRAAMHGGWMDSGDLGYQADGELFVTGRDKDLIIQGGRNLSAEEIEALVSEVAGIRPNCVAAFGVPDPIAGTERLVVVAETKETDTTKRQALQRAVRERLVSGIGTPPDVVVIVGARTVLKTSSGKIRRSAVRDAFVRGTLGRRPPASQQQARLLLDAATASLRSTGSRLGDALFTIWIIVVSLATLPVLWAYIAIRRPGRHAARAAKCWSRCALTISGLRPHVVGAEHLCGLGSAVLIANHSSYVDPVVLMAAVPVDFHFVAKRTLEDYPVIGAVIRKAEHLTIQKAAMTDRLAGADAVAQRLRDGDRLVMFPEGTFVRRAGLLPFRLGAFRAAVDAGRPIVPIAIDGTRHVWPDEAWLFRPGRIAVTIGEPLTPQAPGWPEMVRLRDAAVAFVSEICGETAPGHGE